MAIVRGSILDYAERHPDASDLELVVEVADTTLKHDCEIKDKIYAQAGIQDYWVIDIRNRQLHVFRQPTSAGYTNHLILTEPNEIAPLFFLNASLSITTLFPPIKHD